MSYWIYSSIDRWSQCNSLFIAQFHRQQHKQGRRGFPTCYFLVQLDSYTYIFSLHMLDNLVWRWKMVHILSTRRLITCFCQEITLLCMCVHTHVCRFFLLPVVGIDSTTLLHWQRVFHAGTRQSHSTCSLAVHRGKKFCFHPPHCCRKTAVHWRPCCCQWSRCLVSFPCPLAPLPIRCNCSTLQFPPNWTSALLEQGLLPSVVAAGTLLAKRVAKILRRERTERKGDSDIRLC